MNKPRECIGCPLYEKGHGFAKPVGPANSPILIVGEALGTEEAKAGEPFVGPSGKWLDLQLSRAGLDRSSVRITNIVSCQPPKDWLDGAPWEKGAIEHCRVHLDPVLLEQHKVVVAIGAVATRNLLGLPKRGFKQQNWHGTVTKDPLGRLVIPTFHPAFILRGYHNLTGAFVFALARAKEIATHGWKKDTTGIIVDPTPEAFNQWVEVAIRDAKFPGLAVDIETVRKSGHDESEVEDEIANDAIVRINFSYNHETGLTVPWEPRYFPGIRRLLSSHTAKAFWNARYDVPRIYAASMEIGGDIHDWMLAWHILQSDLPKGLGFVAPFYSNYGPWKHLSDTDPGQYAALDAVQTYRCASGIYAQLQRENRWHVYERHVRELDEKIIWPMEKVGLLLDKDELKKQQEELEKRLVIIEQDIRELVPPELTKLTPPKGLKKQVDGTVERTVVQDVLRCFTCGKAEVTDNHKCGKLFKGLKPDVQEVEMAVQRYFRQEPFNPNSSDQILAYMKYQGHRAGTSKSHDGASTDEQTLKRLAKKDNFYNLVLDLRATKKEASTYVEGLSSRIAPDGRIHPEFLHIPSTGRLSSRNPNFQNVNKKSDIRKAVVAAPGYVLFSADYSAIEAVETGWFAGDKDLIRLAKLGIHGYVVSELHKEGLDLSLSDADLRLAFESFKKRFPKDYDKAKRTVYGTFYGMTPIGLYLTYPELFTGKNDAARFQAMLFDLIPAIPRWHEQIITIAHKQKYLGGENHPFGYKHWFWNVLRPEDGKLVRGPDANRAIAYYPQSTAAGVIKESCLELSKNEDFMTCGPEGKTPIRALIHDDITCEFPEKEVDKYGSILVNCMQRPIAQQPLWWEDGFLSIGVAAKVGRVWSDMEEWRDLRFR